MELEFVKSATLLKGHTFRWNFGGNERVNNYKLSDKKLKIHFNTTNFEKLNRFYEIQNIDTKLPTLDLLYIFLDYAFIILRCNKFNIQDIKIVIENNMNIMGTKVSSKYSLVYLFDCLKNNYGYLPNDAMNLVKYNIRYCIRFIMIHIINKIFYKSNKESRILKLVCRTKNFDWKRCQYEEQIKNFLDDYFDE